EKWRLPKMVWVELVGTVWMTERFAEIPEDRTENGDSKASYELRCRGFLGQAYAQLVSRALEFERDYQSNIKLKEYKRSYKKKDDGDSIVIHGHQDAQDQNMKHLRDDRFCSITIEEMSSRIDESNGQMGGSFSGLNVFYDTVNGGDVWINENRFRIVRQLGEDDGTYGMKKVLIQTNEQLELVREEIRVSTLFSHPNLLPLLDHAIISVKAIGLFERFHFYLLFV
ncbi:hypothetical protein GIB67_001230, partial [Kingdonia uniflora]